MVNYLDFDLLDSIDASAYQAQKPYPWINPRNLITPDGWAELERDLPSVEDFAERMNEARRAGQKPHDRYSLEWKEEGVEVADSWRQFIGELRSDRYRNRICELFGVKKVEFRLHWHYTPAGGSVSPHVDALREAGSHIFYFNSPAWEPSWGGQTLILDDGRRWPRKSAPDMDSFDQIIPAACDGNTSLLFQGRDHGWHSVNEFHCPEDQFRRIFIVIINPVSTLWKIRDRLIGKSIQRL